jgi:hypothetical protein
MVDVGGGVVTWGVRNVWGGMCGNYEVIFYAVKIPKYVSQNSKLIPSRSGDFSAAPCPNIDCNSLSLTGINNFSLISSVNTSVTTFFSLLGH